MTVRPEAASDRDAVRRVHATAFATPEEADLVDALRAGAAPLVSLVAEEDGDVVGHVMFSPVALPDHPELRLMGLAPLAVVPGRQRSGIGAALTRAGLEHCREIGVGAVVVLGHPDYYPRFGFVRADAFGIGCPFVGAPADAWMLLELDAGHLRGASGTARRPAGFDAF
jgi:putative acetyltransferase